MLSAEINPVENIMDSSHVKVIHNNSDLQCLFSKFRFKHFLSTVCRHLVLTTNSNFLIHISLQPDCVNL